MIFIVGISILILYDAIKGFNVVDVRFNKACPILSIKNTIRSYEYHYVVDLCTNTARPLSCIFTYRANIIILVN